ncbi:M23 family metallopeptidase [Croceibacterium sp. TMG7-5b_MA50]|uniref:M23 family metallopeptidase n=1 Tax=Croceibacterium sp. TMG7-5b_MA50 TaxID=3121290 RepID=UPI003221FC64
MDRGQRRRAAVGQPRRRILRRPRIAVDLGRGIGSRRWLTGLAALVALATLALVAVPDFSPLVAAPPVALQEREADEFRSLGIAPLALGADSGRHMGASLSVTRLKATPDRPRIDVQARFASGDTYERLLARAGVGGAEAAFVSRLIGQRVPAAQVAAGTPVDLTLGRRAAPGMSRPLEQLEFRARFDLALGIERRGGTLALVPRPIRTDATPLRLTGKVGDGLYRSARAAGAPARAVQQYLRALGPNAGVAAGDEYDMVIAWRRAATGEVEEGELLYAGLTRNGRPRHQLLRWGREGRFFEASGVGQQREGMAQPVPGPITSRYGPRRHPILRFTRMHAGNDYRAGHGTPIRAVTDGTVTYAGRHGGHGNFVRLRHAGGLGTGYAHMSRIAVRNGASVKRGQVIGYVGSTGLSTGPHLHFEVYRGGRTVNPSSVRFTTRAQLEGRELANFRARLAELRRVTPGAALQPLPPEPAAAVEAKPLREIDRVDTTQVVG